METILDKRLSARQARRVARTLKKSGFSTITIEECRRTVKALAYYCAPKDFTTRERVTIIIAQAAGLIPEIISEAKHA